MFLRSNPGVTHCKKKLKFKLLYFQNKACHRAENRSADISLKCLSPDKGKNSKVLIVVFSDVTWKPRIYMQIIRSQSVLLLAGKFMYWHFLAGMGSFRQLLYLRKGKVLSGKVFPWSAIAVDFHSVFWEICQHSSRKLAGCDDSLVWWGCIGEFERCMARHVIVALHLWILLFDICQLIWKHRKSFFIQNSDIFSTLTVSGETKVTLFVFALWALVVDLSQRSRVPHFIF